MMKRLAAIACALACLVLQRPAAGATTTCGWPIKADPDLVNIAWPDQSANYWAAPFTVAPGTSMTISGRFPAARYMSFHLYEGSMPVDAVADEHIVPKSGTNPFVAGAARTTTATYTIRVVAGSRPSNAKPNTLYAHGMNGEPNAVGFVLYRIYLPEHSAQGGVPLPTVRYTNATGTSRLPCPNTGAFDRGLVNDAIRRESLPASWPGPVVSKEPAWGLSRSGSSGTAAGPLTVNTGNPFFANFDNVYLSLLTFRDRGDVVAFRAKAPTFAETRDAAVMPSGKQVRYWSVCSNDFPTTRYVACTPDETAHLDGAGYFTYVISDPAHKPHLAPTDNWLPAGPYPDVFVLYRQMLPDASFTQAIANAPDAASAPQTMGPYFPATRVCSTQQFNKDRCGL